MTTITSTQNAVVKAARRLGRSQGQRASGAVLVEGVRVVREARPVLRRLFVGPDVDAEAERFARDVAAAGVDVVPVSAAVLRSLSRTITPQGLVGIADLPAPRLADVIAGADLVVLLCEVNDPGNLGAVLRSADAAGADAVITTPGSVDARNAKAVRASAGSVFHLPVVQAAPFDEVVSRCRAAGLQVVSADASGGTPYTAVDFSRRTCIVLGSEAHGLGRERLENSDVVAAVGMFDRERSGYGGTPESLNLAATATLMTFEAARQRASADTEAPR